MVTKAASASEQTAKAEEFASAFPPDLGKVLLTDAPTVHEALSRVMQDVQAIGKDGYNKQQDFPFRGIDGVMNAVGPAFRRHGVIVAPHAEELHLDSYTTRNGTVMRSCVVKVRFVFAGPRGDTWEAEVYGEASDAGDKAVSKAHSVAFRIALLQALTMPTHEPDPDETSHERAAPPPAEPLLPEGWRTAAEQREAWDELRAATKALPDDAAEEVKAWVKAHVPNLGAFTAALADEWRNALPAESPAESLPLETK